MNFLSVPFFLGLHQLRHPGLSFWNSRWKPWQIEVLTGAGHGQQFRISRGHFSRWSDKMSKSVRGAEQASIISNILKQASIYVLCFSIVGWLRLKILSEPEMRALWLIYEWPWYWETWSWWKSLIFLSRQWQWPCTAIRVPETVTPHSAFPVWEIPLDEKPLSHAIFWVRGSEFQ